MATWPECNDWSEWLRSVNGDVVQREYLVFWRRGRVREEVLGEVDGECLVDVSRERSSREHFLVLSYAFNVTLVLRLTLFHQRQPFAATTPSNIVISNSFLLPLSVNRSRNSFSGHAGAAIAYGSLLLKGVEVPESVIKFSLKRGAAANRRGKNKGSGSIDPMEMERESFR